MIQRTFYEPNYRCSVREMNGKTHHWLTFAVSEEELRVRLVERGYVVETIAPYDFHVWRTEAADETESLISTKEHHEPITFKDRIWRELKLHLFEVFAEKCAYCESYVLHIASGDVEHYRPKKGVDEDPEHSGYFWLAYMEENLLPCCEECNRSRGKSNHFPIQGARAWEPLDDIRAEEPLMLNPYFDSPKEHLYFVPGIIGPHGGITFLGTVEGLTDRGLQTIEICNLWRRRLNERRKSEQEHFRIQLGVAMVSARRDQVVELWLELLKGNREYAGSILAQIGVLHSLGYAFPSGSQELTEYVRQHT